MSDRELGKAHPDEPEGDWKAGWRPEGWDYNDEIVRFGSPSEAERQKLECALRAPCWWRFALWPPNQEAALAMVNAGTAKSYLHGLRCVFRDKLVAVGFRKVRGRWQPPLPKFPDPARPWHPPAVAARYPSNSVTRKGKPK